MQVEHMIFFLNLNVFIDNVLIDVLYSVKLDRKLPVGLVRFLRNLLWYKALVFYVGGVECMTLTGYKDYHQF
jgi:hypothetical protein